MVADVPTTNPALAAATAAAHGVERWWHRRSWPSLHTRSDDARFYLGRARRALDHGDPDQAAREAMKAIELDPTSPWPLITLARCSLATGQLRDAIAALHAARDRAPGNRYVTDLLREAHLQLIDREPTALRESPNRARRLRAILEDSESLPLDASAQQSTGTDAVTSSRH